MEFRKDIEGLRALAIVLVVAAHAGMPGLSGGFIGVDVFFVLSGFLITGVLHSEYQASGSVSLWIFYAKRCRRLLPALLVMLLGAGAAGYFLLPHEIQADAAHTGLLAAVWLSNFHFAFAQVDYFGADKGLNLFLHTWSLGVEEQFYLVWPGLLLAFLGLGRVLPGDKLRTVLLGLGVVAFASLAACVWLTPTHPMWAYYLMPTRAWQFAGGALVYLWMFQGGLRRLPASVFSAIAALGIAGLGLTLALVHRGVAYPGLAALLPTASVMLVLLAGSRSTKGITFHLLASAPMQYFGRVSYSWYLWHWPVLVVGLHGLGMDTGAGRLQLILASLALAHLSLVLVESPIRRAAVLLRQPRATTMGAVMMTLAAAALFLSASNSIERNYASGGQDNLLASAVSDVPSIYGMGCDDYYRDDRLVPCVFDPPAGAEPTAVAVIAGDSIGLHWFPAVEEALVHREGWRLVVLTKSACPMVDHSIHNERIGRMYVECDRWKERVVAYLRETQPDLLILGSNGGYGLTPREWEQGTRRFLERVSPSADETLIFGPTPSLLFGLARCRPEVMNGHVETRPGCTSPALSDTYSAVLDALVRASETAVNTRVLPMHGIACPTGTCSVVMNDLVAFRDNYHLTASFVMTLADRMHDLLRPGGGRPRLADES